MRVRFKEGREWISPILLFADDLVLCGYLEDDLRAILKRFILMGNGWS